MKRIFYITFFAIVLITGSCRKIIGGYKYEQGSLPEYPVNLLDFNTAYDDYNSTAPSLGRLIPFCFSTNRYSRGNKFDIIYEPMNVNFDKTSGELTVINQYDNWSSIKKYYDIIRVGINKIKTTGNEFGPNLIIHENLRDYDFTLLYSTDITGNAQINFVSNLTDSTFSKPQEVTFLNSEFEDLYPSFNSKNSKLYFCSNRDGAQFNIYYVDVDPNLDMESLLADTSKYEPLMDRTLSSNFNDKCPFIFENKLVFASNRDGGFGGYDLYYSVNENGEWSAPINFGASINTASDEFRPILINEEVTYDQTMMVFSSNREGGLGGYDLYFLGIDNE